MSEEIACKIFLENETRLEDIVRQLQAETLTVLCVFNGYKILRYKLYTDLPKELAFEHKAGDCYWYRSLETRDVYAFFLGSVHYYLLQQEEQYYLKGIFTVQFVK